jgi:UDP-GlcNAc:undecaprenyl-phosphate GlcNAc-1-phosphate transferase
MFNLASMVFLGDMGAYGLGSFVLGLMLIGAANGDIDHGQIVAALAVPVVDCVWLMIERRLRGLSPYDSDRQHLHHILEGPLGSWPSLALYLFVASLGMLGAIAGGWSALAAIVVQFVFVAAARLWLPRPVENMPVAATPAAGLAPVEQPPARPAE